MKHILIIASHGPSLINFRLNLIKTLGLSNIKNLCKSNHVIFDLKNLFNSNQVDLKL
jgi:hypothetical protein